MASDPGATKVELGLRERKKAETRQRISDLATEMFLDRGFDAVRVTDIAERAGVSEKTVFNYFPTKESLVLDQTDAQVEEAIRAVSERPRGTSPVRAYVDQLIWQMRQLTEADFERVASIVPRFGAMLDATPTLRAAWGDHRHHMVAAVAEVLAADLGVDALDPEPRTAARALVSLTELAYDSLLRNILEAESGPDLMTRVQADLERGTRLLDTGMWSLSLTVGGRPTAEQVRAARAAAETGRRQVASAVREARRRWREVGMTRGAGDGDAGRPGRYGRHLRGRGRA